MLNTSAASDFTVPAFDFAATTVTFVANTPAARQRIWGGVSIEVTKSSAPQFFDQLLDEGFSIEAIA